MLYGVMMFVTDQSLRPDEAARLAEERGFESIWFAEHTHIPANRQSQLPGGNPLPESYWHGYDPYIALTAAAMVTNRINLGTGISLVAEHDPIVLAKQIASLDLISNGRFMLGIGGGWNKEEMENHGTPFNRRFSVLREDILAMKEIWTKDEAEFHGRYVNFDPIWSWPKPVQKPHPPIIMGGDAPHTFDRVIEFCDGWMPGRNIQDRGVRPNLADKVSTLRDRARAAGRDPASISVSITFAIPDRANLERIEEDGATRAIFMLPSAKRDVFEPEIDRMAALIK